MVRSLWIRTLATTLVWTGVTWAQQSTSVPDDKKTEQILTIQETGKGPQKCKVIRTWRTGDGHQAYQVRNLDTGEMMTITEKATAASTYGAKPQSIATQIFHWGPSQASPPGVPVPAGGSPAIPAANAKNYAQPSGSPASPYTLKGADSVKAPVATPYSSPSNSTTTGAKNITSPVPEKDWRQSWAKADEKPLRIEDKPALRDSIADFPPLKIEGKPPSYDQAVKAKQSASQPKVDLNPDDPLMNPEKYMPPKVLDLTPRTKAAEPVTNRQLNARDIGQRVDEKSPARLPGEPSPARVPTIADLAGARSEPKKLPVMDKPLVVIEASKPAAPVTPPVMPMISQPTLVPPLPPVVNKPVVVVESGKTAGVPASIPALPVVSQPTFDAALPAAADKSMAATEAAKVAGPVIIPVLPVTAQPSVIPTIPLMAKPMVTTNSANVIGHATASSAPPIPQAPLIPVVPHAPLAVAPPVDLVAPPISVPESRAERPSFLVMDAGSSESSDRSIKLPGVPNAVIAFGQPVTVTAPPPDMIRKKSLEAHSVRTMIGQLKDSLFPSQREWAAAGLTSANSKVHPEVIDALCVAAQDDPAPSVRARCAQSLAAMHVRTETALGVIRKLQADKDESVRAQANEAFKLLGPEESEKEMRDVSSPIGAGDGTAPGSK